MSGKHPRKNRHFGGRKTGYRRKDGPRERLPATLPLAIDGSETLPQAVLAKPTSHPNIFRKRIKQVIGKPESGHYVAVYHQDEPEEQSESDSAGSRGAESAASLLGYGLYNSKSEVAIRMVSWAPNVPDEAYWKGLADRAVELRHGLLRLPEFCDTYRVIHAEADGMPGLVVDRYADCLSAEVFSAAMIPRVRQIVSALADRMGLSHWLVQPGPFLQSQDGFTFSAFSSENLPPSVEVREGDTRYKVEFATGHKTGFFCDQRSNRQMLAEHCVGKDVLDVCCYTGGFSIMAAHQGKASSVTGVDLDEAPLKTAQENARLNGVRCKFTQADAFGFMRDMIRNGRMFDVVVLDPPKLIRNRSEIDEGTRKHFDLNRLAMQLVRPGGLMLSCTCAGLLAEHDFLRVVRAAGRSAFRPSELNPNPEPRNMQIFAKTGAAACHPISANCPETEYLNAVWVRL